MGLKDKLILVQKDFEIHTKFLMSFFFFSEVFANPPYGQRVSQKFNLWKCSQRVSEDPAHPAGYFTVGSWPWSVISLSNLHHIHAIPGE